MPDPLRKDIQKVDHSKTTLMKIQRYRMAEDFSQLEGMDVPQEIESIRQGLARGSTDSFLELSEYMWLELVRENSVLRAPLREFIERNKLIRLVPPTPLIPIIFLFSGEETLKEWCIVSVCELYSTPGYLSGMAAGGTFFYKMHREIHAESAKYKERNFLKSLFIFVVLGGALVHPHYSILEEVVKSPKSDSMAVIFSIYKILIAGEVSITGEPKKNSKNNLELIEKTLDEILKLNLDHFLSKNRQEPSDIKILLLFTTWEMLELGIKLNIKKSLKLLVLKNGYMSNSKSIIKRVYLGVVEMSKNRDISLIDLFQSGMLEYLLFQAEYAVHRGVAQEYNSMMRSLVLETVDAINTYTRRIQEVPRIEVPERDGPLKSIDTKQLEIMLITCCRLWRDRLHAYSDCVVSAFISLFFFRMHPKSTRYRPEYHSQLHIAFSTLNDAISSRLDKIDKSTLNGRDSVMMASFQHRKHVEHLESVEVEVLLSLIKECTLLYKMTHIVPAGVEGLCMVIEKYISNYILSRGDKTGSDLCETTQNDCSPQTHENIAEECVILKLLYALLSLPITDPVLSQINYIVVNLDKIVCDGADISFEWIHTLDLKMAAKGNLKLTFLKNLFDKYLLLANDHKTVVKSVVNSFQRIQKENALKEDEAMKRLFKRAERMVDKKKDQTVEHAEKDTALLPRTQNIIAWQKPPQPAYEEICTNRDFIISVVQNRKPEHTSAVKPSYAKFSEYFEAYSSNIIQETLASIEANSESEEFPKVSVDGIVIAMCESQTITTFTVVYLKQETVLLINDVVKIESKDGSDSCTGLVMHHKNGQCSIAVDKKTLEQQNRYYKVNLQVVANVITGMREYDALIRMQSLSFRHKIFSPCKPANTHGSFREKAMNVQYQKNRLNSLTSECKEVAEFYNQLNKSQQTAVMTALHKDITLIQGPPGTGKTKTISSIISHLLLDKHRVLVCAPSNAAVDMLIESGGVWKGLVQSNQWMRVGSPLVSKSSVDNQHAAPDPAGSSSMHISESAGESLSSPSSGSNVDNNTAYGNISQQNGNISEQAKYDCKEAVLCARLVFSTLSMAGSIILKDVPFDAVVIDEACQATEPSSIIPLRSSLKTIVLVGDPMQLPPTILSQSKDLAVTLFERMSVSIPPILLDTQYRMHAAISEFASNEFYNGKLKNGVSLESCLPFAFIDAAGTEEVNSKEVCNRKECAIVAQLLPVALKTYASVGVISPYKGQVRLMKSVIKNVEISTVDGFQGQEKDCIVISTVRSKKIGFLNDIRRMNVALTRAKYTVIVVGSMDLLKKDPTWKSLIEYVKKNKFVYTARETIDILKRKSQTQSK
ncbi:regulator of nonsense transcripts 1 [Nematocida minor]|uniref:regulator of nonsense transcripts 1 n=1 Tax=Nematocida minor TaxID=1912983 RepID=UPI00221F364D|nr:regulator of nonsense transcripts 1 [Nematocida minor]KAI5191617.1 regulator of nonsense transcripts 1 [Nematocida minor]